MSKEFLHMQMLAGIITEGEYKAKLKENTTKKPLKENFVGIGAINSPFAQREKTDYELAFEHFTKGTSPKLNELIRFFDDDGNPIKQDKDDLDELIRFFDDDGNPIKQGEGEGDLGEGLSFMGTEEEPEIMSKWEEMTSMNSRTTPDDIANMLGLDPNLVAATLNARLGKNYPVDPNWNQFEDDSDFEDDFNIKISEADTETEKETETETETERKRRRNIDIDPEKNPDTRPKAVKESKRPLRVKAKRSK